MSGLWVKTRTVRKWFILGPGQYLVAGVLAETKGDALDQYAKIYGDYPNKELYTCKKLTITYPI